jgi:hypothetical protein
MFYFDPSWTSRYQTPIYTELDSTAQRPKKITERFDKDGNLIERITEDLEFED